MSSLNELKNSKGAVVEHYRKGRGVGSGNGKTAGKGQKGQGAHAHTKKNGFEGGQTPIARRLPKFGVRKTHTGHHVQYVCVSLSKLDAAFKDGDTVNITVLLERKLVKKELDGLKVLGNGELTKKLVVEAKAFSASAKAAIEAKGGEAKVIE
ncbi:MAG: 50S ribosomal protein L15 [Bacilli bacterium]|nr:50S ribosomal protein L15 [Bacilli bacterium]